MLNVIIHSFDLQEDTISTNEASLSRLVKRYSIFETYYVPKVMRSKVSMCQATVGGKRMEGKRASVWYEASPDAGFASA